jgi:hypothetical protein
MSFNHEAIAALPVGSAADKALMRAMATRRMAYCLSSTESAASFTAVDPDAGTIPLYIIQNALLFQLDPVDTTTAPDGVTCLVTADSKRYKTTTLNYPWSVLTRATIAEPALPAVGDRYLIPTAATGADWAGKDGTIGIFTAAGWFFAVVPIGRLLYVQDETAFYHRNASGVWTAGVGSIALGPASVNITNVLGAKASYVVKVENQTTNTPPVSPTAPTAYIIGPSPTGSWSGNAGRLAICLVAGTFTIITPATGDQVFDKSLNINYQFNGTTWISSAGAFVGNGATVFTASTAGASRSGSTFYGYSDTAAPSFGSSGIYDATFLTYTAKRAGNAGAGDFNLVFDYQARTAIANTSGVSEPKDIVAAIFRDSVTAGLDWIPLELYSLTSVTQPGLVKVRFEVAAPDALSHVYKIAVLDVNANVTVQNLSRRRFSLMERA